MAKFDVINIPAINVEQIWFMIEPLVEDGILEENERYTVEEIKNLAIKDRWQTWVAWDVEKKIVKVVAFTELYTELSGLRVASIRFLSGRERSEWLDLLPILEERMAGADVQMMEVWARRGWLRELPEYKMTHVLLEKDLTNGQISKNSGDNPRHDGSTRLDPKSKSDPDIKRESTSNTSRNDIRNHRSTGQVA